jgi:hypothetical protein
VLKFKGVELKYENQFPATDAYLVGVDEGVEAGDWSGVMQHLPDGRWIMINLVKEREMAAHLSSIN